ncbi:hypothetical protein FGRA07_11797 [Fusarium graminearum]|uniref:Uncharacterized protein n=1 Tax=Gibberella zeae TaxID=5518 RepID=A0A2H3FJQ6_GIBZA|nr:hypothetical protein FGRA07_11797 [Fusarium graminearum]
MELIQPIEKALGCPNHRRAIPVFFGGIELSLNDIYHHHRHNLEESDSFEYIEDFHNLPNKLLAKIHHFGYTAFLASSIARHSRRKREAQEKVDQLEAAINYGDLDCASL